MRARWMDPALGRFISEDPAGDGVNWFVYCRNNPVSRTDSSGNTSKQLGAYVTVVYSYIAITAGVVITMYAKTPMDIMYGVGAMTAGMLMMLSGIYDMDYSPQELLAREIGSLALAFVWAMVPAIKAAEWLPNGAVAIQAIAHYNLMLASYVIAADNIELLP